VIFDPGWPTCAVCSRPVDKLTRWEDATREKLTVIAECHGETESVDIAESELIRAPDKIKFTVAFQTKRLSVT
jgi:hypothetical protein